MNTEIQLPTVESCSMEGEWQGDGGVKITVSIDSSQERQFAHGLRLIAERYDPQQFDEELAAARHAIAEVARLRKAVQDVIAFQFVGGEMLKSAVSVLESVYEEVQHCEG